MISDTSDKSDKSDTIVHTKFRLEKKRRIWLRQSRQEVSTRG